MNIKFVWSRKWVVAGLIAYGVGLLAFAPASWFDVLLRGATKDRIALANADGTIWRGSGNLRVIGKGSSLGLYQWSFQPKSLLQAKLQFNLLSSQNGATAVTLGPDGLKIDQLKLELPVEVLGGVVPEIVRYAFHGFAAVDMSAIQLLPGNFSGGLRCEVSSLSSPIVNVPTLGSYLIDIAGQGKLASITMATKPGSALLIDGTGSFAQGKLTFNGQMRPSPEQREVLKPFLSAVSGGNGEVVSLTL